LNRATLGRQLPLRRQDLGVVDAVRAMGALQAQSAASPYIGLWNRLTAFDPAALDRAFAERAIVRATLMRTSERDRPDMYRRCAHWWTTLPSAQVCMLAG